MVSPGDLDAYDARFFAEHRDGSRRSARRILPRVLAYVPARSVVDVGCGTGAWLSVLAEHGVTDVFGVDGAPVDPSLLELPSDRFLVFDLREPLHLPRRFDLVLCLEVAEHLPAASADVLVASLVALGPCVLFSAAIPGQGGTDHVNEQWPRYWVERFAAHGYRVADALRPHVWTDAEVEPWYAQNALLFVDGRELSRWPDLAALVARAASTPLDLVHPRLWSALSARAESETARALEHYGLATALQAEVARLKQLVVDYADEVRDLKDEGHAHRSKAEAFAAEVEQLKTDLAEHRGRAESFYAEVESLRSRLHPPQGDAQDPH